MIQYKLVKYISLMMEEIPSLYTSEDKNFQKLSELINRDNNSLVIDISHAKKFTPTKILLLMVEFSRFAVLINSPKTITNQGTLEIFA